MYPRVYAPQPPRQRQDVSDAETYGEIVYLLPRGQVGGHPGVPWSISVDNAMQQMREALTDYGPRDYLLLLGDPVAIAMMTTIAASMHPTVQFLRWDRQDSRYYCVVAHFDTENRQYARP